MNVRVFEGVAFNADALYHMTEQEFMDHEAHHGFSAEQLKEVYKLIKSVPADKIPKPAVPYVAAKKVEHVKETEKK